jgi:beta-glucanase (GH16 family)
MKARFLAVLFMTICTQISVAQYTYNKLVWQDEFNGNGLLPDTTKWSYDTGNGCPVICGWGNNELQCYLANRKENARTENGFLIIEAHKENGCGKGYTSARMTTRNKADWTYGRFEIRAKLPSGKGIWPAIWMLPVRSEYGIWPHSGEIDIMENVGYMPDSVFGTVHTGAFNGMLETQKSKGIYQDDLTQSFHNYGVEWTTDRITFFFDGYAYFDFKRMPGSDCWPFDKAFYLILNVAVGGNWGGKYGVDESIFPQKLLVDYVRVFQ